MNFIITMAGEGSRFKQAGYELPKFLLEAGGKKMIEWSLEGLPLEIADKVIFIGQKKEFEKYEVENQIRELYPTIQTKFFFVLINGNTEGQAITVLSAEPLVSDNEQIVIFNIDTNFKSSTLKSKLLKQGDDYNIIGSFKSDSPNFSYAKSGKNYLVTKLAEKEVISTNALTGLYHFSKWSDFKKVVEYYISNSITIKNEYYIAPMYNQIIKSGGKVVLDRVSKIEIMGTPEEYERFKKMIEN
jgi:dTDP-glucose pyrophosphorylase